MEALPVTHASDDLKGWLRCTHLQVLFTQSHNLQRQRLVRLGAGSRACFKGCGSIGLSRLKVKRVGKS
jgi:hypothetical protein